METNQRDFCLIFGAGDYFGLPAGILENASLVVAADGGLRYTERESITPDIILGDFDSYEGAAPASARLFPPEKDDTDMLLGVKEGLERGFRRFALFGGVGGRFDHTVANLQTLAFLARRGGIGFLFDRESVYTVLSPARSPFRLPADAPVPLNPRGKVSVFAFGGRAEGVTLSGGLKYRLKNAALTPDMPLGVSNELSESEEAGISLSAGMLLLCLPINGEGRGGAERVYAGR